MPGNKVGFAEIKRPGEEPRKLQQRQIAFLKSLGCYTMVIDCKEDIPIFLGGLDLWNGAKTHERNI